MFANRVAVFCDASRTLLRLALASVVIGTTAAAATPIVIDSKVYGGNTYHLLSASKWTEAEAAAISLGGHLVTIDSSAENTWVYDSFTQSLLDSEEIGSASDARFWIGLNDAATVFNFVWSSGSSVAFTNWSPGEPNNNGGTEKYVHMWSGGTWNDAPNNLAGTYGVVEIRGVVSAPGANSPWAPVDLAGTYLAARNSTVGATTDPGGIGAYGMVQEPSNSWRFTPFSNRLKLPTALEGIDLRGQSYGFDVDLGDKNRWPNPSSVQDWFAGNAADGHFGSTLVIRAAGSNGSGAVNLSDMNGLRILFYRKDGKFFAHVANLWYSQDVNLPGASVATRYGVQVDVTPSGAIRVWFKQSNGAGSGATTCVDLVGGSIENGGLSDATFLVQMVNACDPDTMASSPTKAMVSRFWTTGVPNALYAYCAFPYLNTATADATAIFGLYNSSVSSPMAGYQVSTKFAQSGGSLSFYSGQYENVSTFDGTETVFAPNGNGRFDHARTASPANATSGAMLLESYNFFAPQGSSNTGNSYLKVLPTFKNTAQLTGFFTSGLGLFPARPVDSNGVVLDPFAPTLGSYTFLQHGEVVTSGPLVHGSVSVQIKAADVGSGLYDHPYLTALLTDNHGVETTKTYFLGSVNPVTGLFGVTLKLPLGTASLSISTDVWDRAGNKAVTASSQWVVVPDSPTLTMTVRSLGFKSEGDVSRLLRFVLGRQGGDGQHGTHARIVINKVVTFNSDGEATVTLTHADGLPEFPAGGITHLWVKDPFHTVGKLVGLKLTGSTYSLIGGSKVILTPGDVTNNNVTDGQEYSIFTGATFGDVDPNTTDLADTSAPISGSLLNLDLNGDGRFDNKDLKLLNKYFGVVGDPEPEDYF